MPKFSEKFICPAPWTNMYYHINTPSPCHVIRDHIENTTVEEYLNSPWLTKLKKDMMSGVPPAACEACTRNESLGLKSNRGAFWRYHNVGDEPEYESMWWANKFDESSPTNLYRMEFRFSNLCNMKCRMCDETSSSEWAKEKIQNDIPLMYHRNNLNYNDGTVMRVENKSIDELKKIALTSKNLQRLCLTGGEPFIMKEYYDFLDFLIEHKLNERISLDLYTNCSVYNPLFVERLRKFKKVHLLMSIDAVGSAAEYIRHGTNWKKVEENIRLLNKEKDPIRLSFNTAISAYVLLNISSLAAFLKELYHENNKLDSECYNVYKPYAIHFNNLSGELRTRAIEEIEKAISILDSENFSVFVGELDKIKNTLETTEPKDAESFDSFTKKYDLLRNEDFKSAFNLK